MCSDDQELPPLSRRDARNIRNLRLILSSYNRGPFKYFKFSPLQLEDKTT